MHQRPYVPINPGPLSRVAASELARLYRDVERQGRLAVSPPLSMHDSASGRLILADVPDPVFIRRGRWQSMAGASGHGTVLSGPSSSVMGRAFTQTSLVLDRREELREETIHVLPKAQRLSLSATPAATITAVGAANPPYNSYVIAWGSASVDTGSFWNSAAPTDINFNEQTGRSHNITGTLASPLSATGTDLTLADTSGWPLGSSAVVLIDNEQMTVAMNATPPWPITSGRPNNVTNGVSQPTAHAAGAKVTATLLRFNGTFAPVVKTDSNTTNRYYAIAISINATWSATSTGTPPLFYMRLVLIGRYGMNAAFVWNPYWDDPAPVTGHTLTWKTWGYLTAIADTPQRFELYNIGENDVLINTVSLEMVQVPLAA